MRRGLHAVALLLALLQGLLGPTLALADARVQAGSAGPGSAHAEDRSSGQCRPHHDDRCVVCQLLSAPHGMRGREGPLVPTVEPCAPASATLRVVARSAQQWRPFTRGPPTLG